MTKLQQLYEHHGQSPWLDNLTRGHLTGGRLARLVAAGIRGVTSNPTIFAKAMSGSAEYDEQFTTLIEAGSSVTDAYWTMVMYDVEEALVLLAGVYSDSGGGDGFVSVELAPNLARDTVRSVAAARELHVRIDQPNLLVKIPATGEGVPAVAEMIGEGRSINITLIFGLERYDEVIEAYLAGLEAYEGDLRQIHSVASFFVSRVDNEVDRRLEVIGTEEALALRGHAALAQARLAYQLFRRRFSGPRWEALAARGARLQRPLWASTSTKNPAYPDTLYVDRLIGPDTVNTLTEATVAAFEDHGTVGRTIDDDLEGADRLFLDRIEEVGIAMADVTRTLEEQGVASFAQSFNGLVETLEAKKAELASDEGRGGPFGTGGQRR